MADTKSDKKMLTIKGNAASAILDAFMEGYDRTAIKVAVLASAKHLDSKALDLLVTGIESFEEALDILMNNMKAVTLALGEAILETEDDDDKRADIMSKMDMLRRVEDVDGEFPDEPSDKDYLNAVDRIEALLRIGASLLERGETTSFILFVNKVIP